MKKTALLLLLILSTEILQAQTIEVSSQRKAIRTSGDIGAALLPVAGLTAALNKSGCCKGSGSMH